MRRYLRPSAVNGPVWLGDYTKTMMINRILTICAAVVATAAGISLAHAQQGYPVSPGTVYSTAPGAYPPGGYVVDERRGPGAPDFDAFDDDEAPNAQSSTALPPPGPVLSPNDPRYGRPMGAPVYSDRGPPMPTGPVLSPDDPRYGRPAGPPPVIYSDRGDDRGGLRPPEAIGGAPGFTWTGVQKISRKAEWPDWHPPTEMIERQPYLPRFMAGGPGNPLGARAMYLGSTVYRIHGTNQPSTIGKFVSSGCIGMLNEDVSDLFDRVKVGTRVVVLPGGPAPASTTTASAQPMPGPSAGPAPAQMSSVPGTQPTTVPPLPAPVTIR